MASRKQVVPMEGGGSTTTTNPPGDWDPKQDTTDKSSSSTFDAYMQQKFDAAYASLKNMDLKKRMETLKFLRSKGFGSASDVSFTGLEIADVARYRELLIYVDSTKGMTVKKAMDNFADLPNVATADVARRKTNIKDVDSVFNDVVVNMLGRQPTKDETLRFRSAYSGMESGGNAPSVQAAAEAQLKEKMPDETKAAQFADYATMFEQMLRGG